MNTHSMQLVNFEQASEKALNPRRLPISQAMNTKPLDFTISTNIP
jgi:hypothetical protein